MKKYGFIIHKIYLYKTKIAYISNQQQIQINKETLYRLMHTTLLN